MRTLLHTVNPVSAGLILCSGCLLFVCASPASNAQVLPDSNADPTAASSPAPIDVQHGYGADAGSADAQSPSIFHLYVATSGSDSNPGSAAAPFRTITRAAAAAKPSTTVHVAPGIYQGNVSTRTSGQANARIRFVSDSKWGARIIGQGNDAHWTNSGNFVDIVGFDISGPGRLGLLNNGSNVAMSGNQVHDLAMSGGCTGNGGAAIVNANYAGSDNDVVGNVIHDIGSPGRCNGMQGIYHSNLRGTIANNVVYRVSAWGIHLWHAANKVTVANNTVFANGAASMGGGILIGSGDRPGGITVSNTKVINNIVYNNPGASISQFCYAGQRCIGADNVTANNLIYGNGRPVFLKVGSATGTVSADPQFIDYRSGGGGNYRLQPGSPAVNRAAPGTSPAYDIDNVPRTLGGAADIGAYESH